MPAAVIGLLIAVAGAVSMVVGSFLHWATLSIGASGGRNGGSFRSVFTLDVPFDGMLLAEGRVAFVLGLLMLIAAGVGARLAFAAQLRQPRWWAAGLAAAGLVVLATTALAMTENPVEVQTLLQLSGNLRDSTVVVDPGLGAWLALAGGVLVVLGAALLALRDPRRAAPDDVPGPAEPTIVDIPA